MRTATRASVLFIVGVVFASSCGDDEASPDPSRPETAQPPGHAAAQTTPRAPATPNPSAPYRVRFDLARHTARAERFHGAARVIDLGAPSGHQHTLGGWRTRAGETATLDGATVALINNVTGFFLLPIESTERCHLSMRARAFGDGRVTVYIDDQTVGHLRLPRDGSFSVAHVDLPAERCTVGEHDLRLRVARTGSIPGHARVGVAVDWLRLGTAEDAEVGPPVIGGGEALRVPAGWTVAYAFEVPEGARLRAEVDGTLEVTVERDGHRDVVVDQRGARLDADLSPFASEIVRLRLRARTDVTLRHPVVVTPGAVNVRPARRMTNALIYLTDTLRADHLPVYEPQTRVETPGLRSWARRAATFLSGHSQENWTKPSCATLLSGLYPWEHHATSEDAQVPDSVELISERLRGAGMHTGAFIANGFVSGRFGFRQGWSTWRNYVREGRRNQARFVAEDVVEWLDARPEDRAFFLYVHTIDPHVPYMPPRADAERYDPEPYDGPVDFTRDRALLEAVKGGRLRLNARDRLHLEALYDAEITYHDRHFATVVEALERRGLDDETILVFTADHGEEFWDHGSVGHGHSVWEELIRVPLLIRWPGVTDGAARIEEAAGLVDVMPTVLDALGMEIPDELSGHSLGPLLRGALEDAPRPTVTGFMDGWRTVVVGHYKLVQRTTSNYAVYDLLSDPHEQRDLAADRPIALRYLRGLLGVTLAEVDSSGVRHAAERTTIDATTRAQLEALGYTGASRAPTDDGTAEE